MSYLNNEKTEESKLHCRALVERRMIANGI